MLLRFIFLALLAAGAFGQELTGTIRSLGADELQVDNEGGTFAIHTGDDTAVYVDKERYRLSGLAVGDEVRVRFHEEASHRRVADTISTRVTLSGKVEDSSIGGIRVRSASNRVRLVHFHASTELGVGTRPPRPGEEVHIVGWNVANGEVDAERVAIYNTDLPMRQDFRK
jgi:hypothetical protein